jgi:hypothetical protein
MVSCSDLLRLGLTAIAVPRHAARCSCLLSVDFLVFYVSVGREAHTRHVAIKQVSVWLRQKLAFAGYGRQEVGLVADA